MPQNVTQSSRVQTMQRELKQEQIVEPSPETRRLRDVGRSLSDLMRDEGRPNNSGHDIDLGRSGHNFNAEAVPQEESSKIGGTGPFTALSGTGQTESLLAPSHDESQPRGQAQASPTSASGGASSPSTDAGIRVFDTATMPIDPKRDTQLGDVDISRPMPSGPRSQITPAELAAAKAHINYNGAVERMSDASTPIASKAAAAVSAVAEKAKELYYSATAPAPASKPAQAPAHQEKPRIQTAQ
jgi:hypothetical protein